MQKSLKYLLIYYFLFSFSAKADVIQDSLDFNNKYITGSFNSVSINDDSTSLAINPGGIGIKREGELFFSNSIYSDLYQTNIFASFSNFNIGYQQFLPSNNIRPLRKYIFGTAFPIIQGISTGISYSHIQTSDNTNFSTSSFDFGLLSRPTDFLSIGFVLRNINTPIIDKTIINRTYALGLGFRPFSWDRLSINLDTEWVEGSNIEKVFTNLGFESEFIDGIVLKGRLATTPKFDNFSFNTELSLNFPYISVGYGRTLDKRTKDAFQFKITLNQNRSIFLANNSKFAEIKLSGNIKSTKENRINIFGTQKRDSLFDYLEDIDKAKNDKQISGIVLYFDNYNSSLAVNEELKDKIIDFKKSGKKVVSFIKNIDLKQLYLASVSDYIVMHPLGEINLSGIGFTNLYFKNLFDKLGIIVEFESVGKYKSAIEPYIMKRASEYDREQNIDFLKDLYEEIINQISESKSIDKDKLNKLINELFIIDSKTAKDLRIVDEISHYDEIENILSRLNNVRGKYPLVDISKINYKQYNWKDENIIAIVNASGLISEGYSSRDFLSGENIIGSDTIARILNILRKNQDVKAVILRIDSGGGSSLASDIISREIELFKQENEKKPIIISMGDIAASGAYWISVFGDKILANKTTITGSIGVFTGKISYDKLLEKIGITTDSFKINDNADVYSNLRRFKDNEKKIIKKSAENIYRLFLEKVAKGRNIPIEKVEEIAQGRIYSGKKAKEINLIDEIGGITKAIDLAKNLSNIKGKFKIYNVNSDFEAIASFINEPLQTFIPIRLFNMINNSSFLSIIPYWNIYLEK
ncbi:MAG: hypothetical protein KatS3mg068_0828 [Candidatus Sericytochromatia bacterium]|nr:MAG: hypothetical protein KatS3mg068_0828 [Candidatus Sericytochromatia bacterium]